MKVNYCPVFKNYAKTAVFRNQINKYAQASLIAYTDTGEITAANAWRGFPTPQGSLGHSYAKRCHKKQTLRP